MTVYLHDPDETLDYLFDWAAWLSESETISDHAVTPTSGITVDSSTADATSVTVWVSGGDEGTKQTLACRITTNQGRVGERTLQINVQER